MLTDRDITVRAIAAGKDPRSTRVDEVMTPEVVCCLETDDVERAAEMMQSAQLRRLLVVLGQRPAGRDRLARRHRRPRPETTRSAGETLEHVSEPPPSR